MTVSAAGFFIRGAVFFPGLRLALALATVFACARLRAVTRLAEFPFRAFARFWTFDRERKPRKKCEELCRTSHIRLITGSTKNNSYASRDDGFPPRTTVGTSSRL
jgi:hypothetical protein